MNSWQARFHTFSKGKRVKKGSTTTLLKWPHSSTFRATPETLAEAGFYFTPSLDTPDAVRCFTCSKELSDWEQDDDPFSEHIRRGVSCCWAIARCGLRDDMDEAGKYVVLTRYYRAMTDFAFKLYISRSCPTSLKQSDGESTIRLVWLKLAARRGKGTQRQLEEGAHSQLQPMSRHLTVCRWRGLDLCSLLKDPVMTLLRVSTVGHL